MCCHRGEHFSIQIFNNFLAFLHTLLHSFICIWSEVNVHLEAFWSIILMRLDFIDYFLYKILLDDCLNESLSNPFLMSWLDSQKVKPH